MRLEAGVGVSRQGLIGRMRINGLVLSGRLTQEILCYVGQRETQKVAAGRLDEVEVNERRSNRGQLLGCFT